MHVESLLLPPPVQRRIEKVSPPIATLKSFGKDSHMKTFWNNLEHPMFSRIFIPLATAHVANIWNIDSVRGSCKIL